ncbi:unnamed protein product [Brassica rapa subsp. trilocularis]
MKSRWWQLDLICLNLQPSALLLFGRRAYRRSSPSIFFFYCSLCEFFLVGL